MESDTLPPDVCFNTAGPRAWPQPLEVQENAVERATPPARESLDVEMDDGPAAENLAQEPEVEERSGSGCSGSNSSGLPDLCDTGRGAVSLHYEGNRGGNSFHDTSRGCVLPVVSVGVNALPDVGMGTNALSDVEMGASSLPDVGKGANILPDISIGACALPDVGIGASALPDVGIGASALPDLNRRGSPLPDVSVIHSSSGQKSSVDVSSCSDSGSCFPDVEKEASVLLASNKDISSLSDKFAPEIEEKIENNKSSHLVHEQCDQQASSSPSKKSDFDTPSNNINSVINDASFEESSVTNDIQMKSENVQCSEKTDNCNTYSNDEYQLLIKDDKQEKDDDEKIFGAEALIDSIDIHPPGYPEEEYLIHDSKYISFVTCYTHCHNEDIPECGLPLIHFNLHQSSHPMFLKWPCEAHIPSQLLPSFNLQSHGTVYGIVGLSSIYSYILGVILYIELIRLSNLILVQIIYIICM